MSNEYVWLQRCEKLTPEVEQVVRTVVFPALEPYGYTKEGGLPPNRTRVIRLRAADVEPMVTLLRSASGFPFTGATTLAKRANMLEKINPADLLADAAR